MATRGSYVHNSMVKFRGDPKMLMVSEKMIHKSFRTHTFRHRFHEVAALRALMHAARPLRENGNDL